MSTDLERWLALARTPQTRARIRRWALLERVFFFDAIFGAGAFALGVVGYVLVGFAGLFVPELRAVVVPSTFKASFTSVSSATTDALGHRDRRSGGNHELDERGWVGRSGSATTHSVPRTCTTCVSTAEGKEGTHE